MSISQVKIYYHPINNKLLEQKKFTYSPLGKAFEKEVKTIEDKGQKHIDALENLKG